MTNTLKRQVGLPGAVLLGLGSIVGTGVFVSLGFISLEHGLLILPATVLAGFLALCNAFSSAQLAANHPVSGGTYAYGNRYLNPFAGFTAGWLFLIAKSFSAATAALGFAGYTTKILNLQASWAVPVIATMSTVLLTALVLSGLRRSNLGNALMVGFSIGTLVIFIIASFLYQNNFSLVDGFSGIRFERGGTISSLLGATALMFVAYTGYGRIATLGEEVTEPKKTIPRAVIATLITTAILYSVVAWIVSVAQPAHHLPGFVSAPLEVIALFWENKLLAGLIAAGAAVALLGVILNLVLGLSRVLFAMGREGDMPSLFGKTENHNPNNAVIGVAVFIIALIWIGDISLTWSFSAVTVLLYYGMTNLCALKLGDNDIFFPRFFSWLGLIGCLALTFWVDIRVYLWAAGLILLGFVARAATRSQKR